MAQMVKQNKFKQMYLHWSIVNITMYLPTWVNEVKIITLIEQIKMQHNNLITLS